MDLSDDEVNDLPEFVSDYYFVDEDDEPISFSVLPFKWNTDEILAGKKKQVFVHGTTDYGLQKIYKLVTAWKFDISKMNPEISVLSKENHWIKLQKPKKSFEGIIRTVLITVNCLHLMKKTPEMSEKLLWDKLSKIFSLLESRPSVNDLIDHMKLIEEAYKRDQSLSKSKFIATYLEDRPEKKKFVEEDGPQQSMKGFIIEDDIASDDGSVEDQLFDSVCAICDNGGRIIPCDGICMRSFHTTPEDAIKDAEADGLEEIAICTSLGYSKKEIRAKATFTCKNCMHKQHQCFSCGLLGSSDISSGVAEVFQCVSAACGYFYHPQCVAKLLHPADEAAAEEQAKNVSAGVPFACPSHNCHVCKQLENHMVRELQFAVCRRCPKSYHRKCLPGGISFEVTKDTEQRAWEDLLHINNRILIYCLKHKIDEELGTPIRNHLKFPGEACQKLKPSSAMLLKKNKLETEKKCLLPEMKRLKQVGPDTSIGKSSRPVQEGRTNEKNSRTSLAPSKRKADGTDIIKVPLKKTAIKKTRVGSSLGAENKESLGNQLQEKFSNLSESANQRKIVSEGELGKEFKTVAEQSVGLEDELDTDSKNRIEDLIKEAEASITLESVYEKYNKLLSTHAQSQKSMLDFYTQGRVEDLVKAIEFASQKLDAGCNVQEAKAVCPPHSLKQTVRWKNRLQVYISPFLIGPRYTSFGRHFTKVEKLKEIVDKIHWYVEDGDTVVDLCCGANDFSSLMKDKLDQAGKKCSYRNFDLFQPKNDFCFEKRDYMTVQPSELPSGSKLVMGLNPPFGVNASLANMFVDKVLEFKPKLIVLIVPQVTKRLDKKKPAYDLVWEDTNQLSGRSFYLPGSIDVNDKQMEDWNKDVPILCLWSRKEWTAKFRKISEKHGHTPGKLSLVERNIETTAPKQLVEATAPELLIETTAQASSDMAIDNDPPEPVRERRLEEVIEQVAVSTKVVVEEDNAKEESHGTSGSVNADPTIISNNKNRQRHKNSPITRKAESRSHPVRDNHHQRHKRPSPKPYCTKPFMNRSSPLARVEPTAIDSFGGTGFPEPSYQHRVSGYHLSPPGHLHENDNIHQLRHPPHEYAHMRDDFGQRPYNSMIHPILFVPDQPSFGQAPLMSTMDRYAPRLDETNYGPMGGDMGLGSLPRQAHNGMYNYQVPGPNYGGGPPMRFAPRPRPPTSYPRSGGYLSIYYSESQLEEKLLLLLPNVPGFMAISFSLLLLTPLIFLSLSGTHAIAQLNSDKESFISVSITEKGIDFLKGLLIDKAISSFTPLEIPPIEKYVKIPVVGKVRIVLSKITIYHIDVNSSDINSDESGVSVTALGATAKLSMNWEYSYTAWVIEVSDRGKASVEVKDMEIGLTVSLDNNEGKLRLSLVESGCDIHDIDIDLDGGASWLYQGLVDAFSQKIESAVEDAISKKIRDGILKVDSRLQSLPKEIVVDETSALNVTVVHGPSISESSIDIGISGLFMSRSNPVIMFKEWHERGSVFHKGPSKMVAMSLHEDVFNSASLVYFDADYMRWTVDKLPDQSLLNTSNWKSIVPQLYQQFPDEEMNLNILVTSSPSVEISNKNVTVMIHSDVSLGVLDGGEEIQVVCMAVVISATGFAKILRNNLTGSIDLDDIYMSLKWSKIGEIQLDLVQPLVAEAIETVLLPRLNMHLMQGFPLPLIHGFSLQSAQIAYTKSTITVSGDVAFSNTDLSKPILTLYGSQDDLGSIRRTTM
ncbi:hypothetical protein V2J09_008445 [Rumex salicifolius]